ncbi:hypothetical protein CLI64_13125 [Nostoc sp. CENA543]|nr:hypothetical protein CLI64_13125 [Nostoc sp. CENA543]
MDWLHKLSIYISVTWVCNAKTTKTKVINAELAAFLPSWFKDKVSYIPIHSFVVIRSQHLKWQK